MARKEKMTAGKITFILGGSPMLGQKGGHLWASSSGTHSHAVTVAMDNRNIFAEVALVRTYVLGTEYMFAGVGISQVVAAGKVENFSEDFPRVIWRPNCATMTFHVSVYKCFAQGRWLANIW